MKKILFTILAILMVFMFAACANCDKGCESNLEYTNSSYFHWNECTRCQRILSKEPHNINSEMKCIVCGANVTATDEIIYNLSEDKTYYEVVGYEGQDTEIIIPGNYNNLPVKSIYDSAFRSSDITAIYIPENITYIGKAAFSFCEELTNVSFPNTLVSIDDSAFQDCDNLIDIELPNGLKNIGSEAFKMLWGINVNSIIIPNSVINIGSDAFWGWKTETIKIGSNVENLGSSAFYDFENFNSYNGGLYLGNDDNPYAVLMKTSNKNFSSFTIHPDTKTIAASAFAECSRLSELVLPENLLGIGSNAFYSCSSLTSIKIPASVKSIGSNAFAKCDKLNGVYISDIASWCGINFNDTGSNPLTIAKKLYLNNTLVTDVVLPDGITSIGSYVFSGCTSLKSITVPKGATSIGDFAFYSCDNLERIFLNNSVKVIGDCAFEDCTSLAMVYGTKGLTSIGKRAFNDCLNFLLITIPQGVTSIGDYAFSGCTWLTINAEAEKRPDSWSVFWNYNYDYSSHAVTWGYVG